jgi:hypothetical protein
MTRVVDGRQRARRGLVGSFYLAAAAMLMLAATPSERASAMSPINPALALSAKHVSDGLLTEVRHGGGGGGHHGGGGGYRGGGVHFSGVRGGYRAGPAFHGGGVRYGGYHYGGGYRAYHYSGYRFAHRHHFHHRRFFYGSYYDYPSYYYYPRHRCHVIWTYHGPRRVCRWHRHRWHAYW